MPTTGQIRINSATPYDLEIYNGSAWVKPHIGHVDGSPPSLVDKELTLYDDGKGLALCWRYGTTYYRTAFAPGASSGLARGTLRYVSADQELRPYDGSNEQRQNRYISTFGLRNFGSSDPLGTEFSVGESVEIEVFSTVAGYANIYSINANGTVTQILPNATDPSATQFVPASTTTTFPDPSDGYRFIVNPPRGRNWMRIDLHASSGYSQGALLDRAYAWYNIP